MPHQSFSLTLIALMAITPGLGALAQVSTNNINNEAGTSGSQMANPQRPAGNANPALRTQTLPEEANGSVPPDKNPNVTGATGHTIVPGNKSTLSGNKQKTIHTRSGP